MPSTYTTSLGDSILGGIGQMFQNCAVFLRNVRPSPGISFCVCLLNSHFRKICSCFVELSILGVMIIEQSLQRHLWDPDLFFPYFVHAFPHEGQIMCLIIPSSEITLFKEDISRIYLDPSMVFRLFYQLFLSTLYLVSNNIKPLFTLYLSG